MSHILITGGAGYIGSHTAIALLERGHSVTVFDNLSTGERELVPTEASFLQGDLAAPVAVEAALGACDAGGRGVDALIHFAASIIVSESVEKPLDYYRNNSVNTTNLIAACVRRGVHRVVFSSTAAVYGVPNVVPIPEDAPRRPINPYGRSKLFSEWVLEDVQTAHPGFAATRLRYFNVAGADPDMRAGQAGPNATHLIKLATMAALGKRDALKVFGTDYPIPQTPDGTCVRDYLHVSDLADIHALACEALLADGTPRVYNCGYGHGYSVRQIVEAVKRVSGVDFPVHDAPRRPGDPPVLVADSSRLMAELGWSARFDDIDTIVEHALAWEKLRP